MVAGVAGIALASLVVSSNPNLLLLLTIKGFAAAIVGGMVSFPIAVGAGFAIGLGEEWVRHYLVSMNRDLFQGAAEVITLGAVIGLLALRPKWIFKGIREGSPHAPAPPSRSWRAPSIPSRRTACCGRRSRPWGGWAERRAGPSRSCPSRSCSSR
jgi:hypothetical protein